jgi:hypothetical protein
MNFHNHTYFSSHSAERTDISSQLDSTQKMIKDLNVLKSKIKQYQKNKIQNGVNSFYRNSIRSLVHKNFRIKLILNNDEKEEENPNFFLPECRKKSLNKEISNLNNTNYNNLYYSRTISNNSNLSLSHSKTKKKIKLKELNYSIKSRNLNSNFQNKFYLTIPNRINSKNESLLKFKSQNKEIIISNYINNIQKYKMKHFNESIQTQNELLNVEIYHLEKMINLIKAYMKDDEKYYEYLKITLKKEKEYNESLIDKKIKVFIETYLLNPRLMHIHKVYKRNIENKFFLLCVKNLTSEFEKFPEEDKEDYNLDLETLSYLSNFTFIEKRLNILSKEQNENLSINEIEEILFGRKLIRKPKLIFNSIESYILKLNEVENNVQNSLVIFNEKQKELNEIRDEYNNLLDLFEQDSKIDYFYKNEIQNYIEKYNEVKIRFEYLKHYKKNIQIQLKKLINLDLVEEKILEVYMNINKKYHISIKRKFNEKVTIITYLKDLERCINQLIAYEKEQILINNENYKIVKKKIERKNKLKKMNEFKEKSIMEFQEKINKVLRKNDKLIIKQRRKIDNIIFNQVKKIKIQIKDNINQ